MKKTLISLLFLSFLTPYLSAQEATPAHKDSLRQAVDRYYSINIRIFSGEAEQGDVEALFELFTDDFVYTHQKYGGDYSRQDLYDGYTNNLKNGNYDGSIADVSIRNKIVGLNAVAIERAYLGKDQEEIDPGMTVFEFRNGLISRITEFW